MLKTYLWKWSGRLCFKQSLHSVSCVKAIKPFKMPNISPIMEGGNIVEWKFKVGEVFNAGDIIMEVKTDKAQINVEAQYDGKFITILKENGSKDIPVGETVAFIADTDDDASTQIPKPGVEVENNYDQCEKAGGIFTKACRQQTLLPSVQILLAENNIRKEEALSKIPASGPNGRLVKGDVLAYLSRISLSSLLKITEYIKKSEKLDLSNIELRKPQVSNKESVSKEKATVKSKDPITIKEQFSFTAWEESSPSKIEKVVHDWVVSSVRHVHAKPEPKKSGPIDLVFEEILLTEPRKPRFSVKYNLKPDVAPRLEPDKNQDIFDILLGNAASRKRKSSLKVEPRNNEKYLLDIELKLNFEFVDTNHRAMQYLDRLKYLVSRTEFNS